eukprot:1157628-Pelagomonas_calceolata.AAC.4
MAACHTLPPLCACVGAEPMVWRYDIKGISEAEQPQQSSTFKFKCKARSQMARLKFCLIPHPTLESFQNGKTRICLIDWPWHLLEWKKMNVAVTLPQVEERMEVVLSDRQ